MILRTRGGKITALVPSINFWALTRQEWRVFSLTIICKLQKSFSASHFSVRIAFKRMSHAPHYFLFPYNYFERIHALWLTIEIRGAAVSLTEGLFTACLMQRTQRVPLDVDSELTSSKFQAQSSFLSFNEEFKFRANCCVNSTGLEVLTKAQWLWPILVPPAVIILWNRQIKLSDGQADAELCHVGDTARLGS